MLICAKIDTLLDNIPAKIEFYFSLTFRAFRVLHIPPGIRQ